MLKQCIELQLKKSQDYQNPNSNVKQAMHYRRGVDSIFDIMTGKMLRIQSLLESGSSPNHESLEDSFVDLINYASFAVSYMRGKMEGQDPSRDMFNKPIEYVDPLETEDPADVGIKISPPDEIYFKKPSYPESEPFIPLTPFQPLRYELPPPITSQTVIGKAADVVGQITLASDQMLGPNVSANLASYSQAFSEKYIPQKD